MTKIFKTAAIILLMGAVPLLAQDIGGEAVKGAEMENEVASVSETADRDGAIEGEIDEKVLAEAGGETSEDIPEEEVEFTSFPKELSLAGDFSAYIRLPQRAVLDKDSYSQKDFEILSATPDESGLNIEIKAVPFSLGVSTFTALTFTGEDGTRYVSKAVNTEVKAVDTGIKEKKMLDIRSPYRPFNYWNIFWLLAIAAIIIGGYMAYRRRRPYDRAALLKAFEEDKRPLDIIALDRLDHLLAGNLWNDGEYKIFYVNMIDILRDYLTLRFNIQAHNYTSRDLLRILKNTPEFKGDVRQLDDLQRSADYVKFAKMEPTQAQRDSDVSNMRSIIIDTRPPRLDSEVKDEPKEVEL